MHLVFGHQTGRVLQKLDNLLWERRLRITTRATYRARGDTQSVPAESHYYGTVSYHAIFKILSFLSLKPSDVFVDLGCGKGRVVCCAATYDIAEAIGIEYLNTFCDQARRNAHRMHGRRTPVSIVCSKAEEFDFTRDNVFYLFNPFGPATLKQVLDRIQNGIKTQPREVTITYVNPVHENVLAGMAWLKCRARLPDPDLSEFGATSFWSSCR
jgi:precorrin-6B methylase 2